MACAWARVMWLAPWGYSSTGVAHEHTLGGEVMIIVRGNSQSVARKLERWDLPPFDSQPFSHTLERDVMLRTVTLRYVIVRYAM